MNEVICSAIQMADRAIRRAMRNRGSCEAEIAVALGTIHYVSEALERERKAKFGKFSLIHLTHTVESSENPNLAETAFREDAPLAGNE